MADLGDPDAHRNPSESTPPTTPFSPPVEPRTGGHSPPPFRSGACDAASFPRAWIRDCASTIRQDPLAPWRFVGLFSILESRRTVPGWVRTVLLECAWGVSRRDLDDSFVGIHGCSVAEVDTGLSAFDTVGPLRGNTGSCRLIFAHRCFGRPAIGEPPLSRGEVNTYWSLPRRGRLPDGTVSTSVVARSAVRFDLIQVTSRNHSGYPHTRSKELPKSSVEGV